jgi:DNA-binding MarR family transcriptional regulator|tara:strand:+ start:201 stop:539 length:339 start_codon:yes stop_codon:yes gene_type:complete
MKLTQNETLRGLAKTLENFADFGDLTTAQIRTFLFVARRGRVTGQDIIKELKMSKANAARTLTILSDEVMVKRKTDTLALITYEIDVNDRRYRYAVLTEKGKKFAASLAVNF